MPSGCGMPLMADLARPRHSRRSTTATQRRTPCGRPRPRHFDDPADLFGSQGYLRGAMTLQALRQQVGSHDFFIILRSWAKQHKYGNVTTAQFIRLSERVSGQDLDAFFHAWLYVAKKPALS